MSPARRILALWFPRLGAERALRIARPIEPGPFATVAEQGAAQVLDSLSIAASERGLQPGQPLRDAQAICPALLTRPADPPGEAAFLAALRRWAGKVSPWVAAQPDNTLVIDLTGCAHLFGGEAEVIALMERDCADMGLSVRAGLADSLGGAWALAHYAGRRLDPVRSGDAIDQEARATRSRATKRRHWTRGGTAPRADLAPAEVARIAPPGRIRQALNPLPVAALRLAPETETGLARVGLRRIEDLTGLPRAALARRFGLQVARRLDQALGLEPEPVSPAAPDAVFAVRLTLPDPIGLIEDLTAGIDRLLPPLGDKLAAAGRGARRLRLELLRCDQTRQSFDLGLAHPSADPARLRPLILQKLDEAEAGFGIDVIRLEAVQTEPVQAAQHAGHLEATRAAKAGRTRTALDDLLGTLGARIGLEAITRWHPADSHIPEKGATVLSAAWSAPHDGDWPGSDRPRPLTLFAPEPVHAPQDPTPPARFRWRGQTLELGRAEGPERLAPEWWLDDPNWRSGVRDYWRVETGDGRRLWLFYAHGGALSAGWFCQGQFA
ncbi:DNA polymerase Y family protein [Dinoroseobacter sp. PD6]|uniref:Y-family DNA polymerase n=1 Tax=Dinoroseobacter sp. PD6 TaxID=3028384 RepID=UPI00237B4079|nr:DNA polymerase Y family protein [Dinoroseobacter sp. PD6]MDD9717916.1 DNA polymerase Y family protein [Dinoroseobacter sp. PD6]